MSQFDFGTIDPNVTDGTQLANFLNSWRDAIYSQHGGASPPAYAVENFIYADLSGSLPIMKQLIGGSWKPIWHVDVGGNIVFDGAITTVPDGSISNVKMADMPGTTFKMRLAGTAGPPIDGTPAQAASLLPSFIPDSGGVAGTKGQVPAPPVGAAAAGFILSASGWGAAADVIPDATTDVPGIVELATVEEAEEGTDTVKAVTPAGLAAAIAAGATTPVVTEYLASTTFAKPSSGVIHVEGWGGGASGGMQQSSNNCAGGGGGAYVDVWLRCSELATSTAITIGLGGAAIASGTAAPGNAGGDTSFGNWFTAYGGGPGGTGNVGGGGGGRLGKGVTGHTGPTVPGLGGAPSYAGTTTGAPGYPGFPNDRGGGGGGGAGGQAGGDAIDGGGGGGGINAGRGGNSENGGGGGGGSHPSLTTGVGGTSRRGGAGGVGAIGTAAPGSGQVPGGGGGAGRGGNTNPSGKGGDGKMRITWFP